jgi:hypothetical protein
MHTRIRRILRPSVRAPLALLALSACAGGSETPVAPPTAISPVAQSYLDQVIALMQRYSINRRTIDWSAFRARVLEEAGTAQSVSETFPAIRQALSLLGDGHSSYIPLRGQVLVAPSRTCSAPTVLKRPALARIGYVRVRKFAGTPAEATTYAQQLQDSIRIADRDDLFGWIVDLRGNSGGNMYPMIAGIGPIVGDGVLGYFLDADSTWSTFSYREGVSAFNDEPLHQVSAVYHLRRPNPRVAVLTDGWVASSGEAVAVAFRGRADTRFFGTPTCGLSTGNASYWLPDTARLVITVSALVDRDRRRYGDVIVPDEQFADPDEAVVRAANWLTYASAATSRDSRPRASVPPPTR